VAGLKRARKEGVVTRNDRAVVVVTGNGLKEPGKAARAAGEPAVLPPDLSEFENASADHPIIKEK